VIRDSLTAKIIIFVGIVITVVIGTCAYIIVKVQTKELMDRAKRDGIYTNHLVNQYITQVMLTGNREKINDFFSDIGKSGEVRHIFLFDDKGRIAFSSDESEIGFSIDTFHRRLFENNKGRVNFEVQENRKIFSIVTPVSNRPDCQRCHGAVQQTLGALVLDISIVPAVKEIAKNRNWIILFALIGLVLVSAVISALIVILVKRPVKSLIRTMTEVERGNLNVKVDVKSRDELGRLAGSFNSMIARLDKAKAELQQQYDMQLQQAEKLASIGELASGIAHEIKNPLAGIGAAIQVIADEFNLKNTHSEIINEIMNQLNRLNKNTRDLLSFARPAEPKFFQGDLNEIVNKAVFFVRKQAEKQDVEIIEKLESSIPRIFLDPEQMQQVFLNIMLNAIQATPKGGKMTITTQMKSGVLLHTSGLSRIVDSIVDSSEKPGSPGSGNLPADSLSSMAPETPDYGDAVEISFNDTGKGIPQEQISRIFNPFFTTKHRGTGLGLAISRNIVEKHGGIIDVESQLGAGTNITVVLPIKGVK
jgi:signal transduction histidine kinase